MIENFVSLHVEITNAIMHIKLTTNPINGLVINTTKGPIRYIKNTPNKVNVDCFTLKFKFENLNVKIRITVQTPITLFSSPNIFV